MNCISRFVSAFKCDALYLVMDKNFHAYRDHIEFDFEQEKSEESFEKNGYPAEMQLMFAYENGHIIDTSDMKTNGIFPLFDSEKSGTDFLFLPLHFKEYAVGYFVIQKQMLTQVQNQLKINIQQELKQIEKETDFLYALEVSIGEVLTDPDSDLGFEDYVRLADEKMYQEKVNRRANRE